VLASIIDIAVDFTLAIAMDRASFPTMDLCTSTTCTWPPTAV